MTTRRTFLVGLGVFAGSSVLLPPDRTIFDLGRWQGQLPSGWIPGKPPEWVSGFQPYWVRDAAKTSYGYNFSPPEGVEAVIDGMPSPAIPGWMDVGGLSFAIDRLRWKRDASGLLHLAGQWGGLYDHRGRPVPEGR